jgi:hypothetical protein
MARKPAAVVEETEDDEVELEELDAEVEDETPKKGKKVEDDVWGVRQLIALLKEKTDKEYSPREVRTLLRKMAREDNARINREIVAGNKSRYSWSGPNDPEVKAVLKAVGAGEIEAGKKAALDKLKADKAAKAAAKTPAPTKGTKAAKTAPPADDDDEEFEEVDDDE